MALAEVVQRIQEVCPLPATAQRVAQLAADPRARIDEIGKTLATDAALAAQVMRIANSAAYGRARQVTGLEQAISLIGLSEIQRMAAAMAMLAAFHGKSELVFGFHDRALLAGGVARVLAGKIPGVDRGTAFLCGLLSEIGGMACAAVDADGYRALLEGARDAAEREAGELARYGATSRQVGGELLRRNGLPEGVAAAVEGDAAAEDSPTITCLTAFARGAAYLLLDVARTGNRAQLPADLAALRAATSLPVADTELEPACLQAAGSVVDEMRRRR